MYLYRGLHIYDRSCSEWPSLTRFQVARYKYMGSRGTTRWAPHCPSGPLSVSGVPQRQIMPVPILTSAGSGPVGPRTGKLLRHIYKLPAYHPNDTSPISQAQ